MTSSCLQRSSFLESSETKKNEKPQETDTKPDIEVETARVSILFLPVRFLL